jgi:hypothetical protein
MSKTESFEETIFAEFEGRIVVLEGEEGLDSSGGAELGAENATEQRNPIGMSADHGFALGDKALGQFKEEPRGGVIDAENMPEIENQEVELFTAFENLVDRGLGGGKHEIPL